MMEKIYKLFGFTDLNTDGVVDLKDLVMKVGLPGLAIIIFAETGLLAGFFLPGDSLLVTAGLFAAGPSASLNILLLNAVLIPCAIVGDAVGYWFGKKMGHALYDRPDSWWFKRKHLIATKEFYEKHGGKTIVIARFMPLARTFAPVVAGIAEMGYKRFATYNIVGGVAWITSMSFIGYFLGTQFPGLVKHIEKVIIVVVFLSILPGIIAAYRAWRGQRASTTAA